MGIRGLQTYLEKFCPNASKTVNILDLLHSQNSVNEHAVIVVDGQSCIRALYDNLEWIGGGQLKQFGDRAQAFVNAFRNVGIRLVFFFDGPTDQKKRTTWRERNLQRIEKAEYVLDNISRGDKSHTIDRRNYFLLPPGMGQLGRVIFENICGCEVHQSIKECDEEIADYAKTQGAFAILSQDSDFVILDKGNALYLSMRHLNLEKMTTRLYDHVVLAESLGIHLSQLPLLATLMGNDVISFEDLKPFHQKMMDKGPKACFFDFKKLFPKVANYIRTLQMSETLSLPELSDQISRTVFGNQSRSKDILTSVLSYSSSSRQDYSGEKSKKSNNGHWNKLLNLAQERHQMNKSPGMIYTVMVGRPFESSAVMEDHRKKDLPLFAEVTKQIRKCLYGILLKEKPLPQRKKCHVVKEWCVAGPDSLRRVSYVEAQRPHKRHPGLTALWGKNPKWLHIRWELFVRSVSKTINIKQLRSIPPYLVIPTMIVDLLKPHIDRWEGHVILATAAATKHYDSARLATLQADPMLPRGIRLSSLFMRITFVIYLLLSACGYPLSVEETAPWNFFDGKLFQAKYLAGQGGASPIKLCDDQVDIYDHFQMAMDLI